MGWRTWEDVGGAFCTKTSGITIGIIDFFRRVLNSVHELLSEEQDRNLTTDVVLRLPSGHEFVMVDKLGQITDFNEWIPKIEIFAQYWNFFGYSLGIQMPKRSYTSIMGAFLAPFDHYFQLDSNWKRYNDDDEEIAPAFGMFSDSMDILQQAAIIGMIVKVLKASGLGPMVKKLVAKLWRMYKSRRLWNAVKDTLEIVEGMDAVIDDIDSQLAQHLGRSTAARKLGTG